MKIRVFKLKWIAQRDLEFKVHEEHSGKKKGAEDRVDRLTCTNVHSRK